MIPDPKTRFDRRAFLQATGAGFASLSLPGFSSPAGGERPDTQQVPVGGSKPVSSCLSPLGLQLYTVRSGMDADFEGTLARVAVTGYRDVEFAGYFGHSAASVSDLLNRYNLISSASHVPLSAFDRINIGRTLADAHTLGHRYLVISAIHPNTPLDGYRRAAEQFNRAAAAIASEGIRFAYHNHAFEFEPIGGEVPYDVLLDTTDPDLVFLEMDLYWINKAGRDPLEYFARWPGRVRLLHAKGTSGPPEHRITDVGSGSIDWKSIFSRCGQAGVEHVYVERDDAPDPFASIAASFAYLSGLEEKLPCRAGRQTKIE